MKTNRWVILAVLSTLATARAGIVNISDDFTAVDNTFSNWVNVGDVEALIKHDELSAYDYDDGNPDASLPYADGMTITGDGLLNDGGLRIDLQDSIVGSEAIGLVIGGTMDEGSSITFSGTLYNDGASYGAATFELWNLTDNTLLIASDKVNIGGGTSVGYTPLDFSLSYTAQASDAGDQLQVVIRDAGNHMSRDIYLDNFEVIPEPATMSLIGFGAAGLFALRRRMRS